MSDLVERLRDSGKWLINNWQEEAGEVSLEAADEIEKLQKTRKEWEVKYDQLASTVMEYAPINKYPEIDRILVDHEWGTLKGGEDE